MTERAFKVRPDIMDAMNAYAARGLTGDNPDTGLWLIPEGSAKAFIRAGFLPPGLPTATKEDLLSLDFEDLADRQRRALTAARR